MNKKLVKIIGISTLWLLMAFFVIKYFYDKNVLKESHRYTVGKVYNFRALGGSGYSVDFSFIVNNKEYKGDYIIYHKRYDLIGKYFIIMFNPDNPKNNKILLNKLVFVDSTKKIPPEGWDKIPPN